MNKGDFVNLVAEKSSMSKTVATQAVDAVLLGITEALKQGEEIRIPGFGNFSVSHRDSYKGRNPSTGEEITIAARRVPRFTPGKSLKDAVQQD